MDFTSTGPMGECLARTPALSQAAPRIRGIVVPPPSQRIAGPEDDEITCPMADVATPTLQGVPTVLGVGTAIRARDAAHPPSSERGVASPTERSATDSFPPPSLVTPSPPLRELPPVELRSAALPIAAPDETPLMGRVRMTRAAGMLLAWLASWKRWLWKLARPHS